MNKNKKNTDKMNRYKAIFVKRFFVLMLAVLPCVAAIAQAPTPTRPSVKGAVFGGGRMADVTGNAVVTVVNCDTISAVYGGNDIAGTVGGANGSTITIGTLTGNTRGVTNARISIGSVYGGGNGYYLYDNAASFTGATVASFTNGVKEMDASGHPTGESFLTSGTIPSIGKTAITVNTDFSYIDSLFGGAKNAFVTNTSDNSTNITINGGTIYSVFGGNNYGGTLGANSTHLITVVGTKTDDNSSVNLGGNVETGHAWTSDDSEHGIRFLFGGGNKVAGQNVHIVVNGGQIDTLFGGGNSADVASTTVDVNVTNPLYTLANSPYTNPATVYSTTTSVFDIRCLFGGNNAADMSGLPTLNLTKGGIHNVYGGGNKGVMLAASTTDYTDNYTRESKSPTNTTYHGANAKRSTNVVVSSADILIDTLYGGGQSAGTIHDTYVEVAGGNVGVVYGGTNIMGRIGPDSHTGMPAPRDLAKTNVYIHGGTIHNAVFGASNGYYRCHDGLNYTSGDNNLFADPNTYSNLAGKLTPAVFNSYIYITTGATILGNVYASGNMAVVGKPHAVVENKLDSAGVAILHIDGGTIGTGVRNYNNTRDSITKAGNVYGGGNMGSVYGGSDLHIGGSAVVYGNVYGGNDKTGRVFSPLRDVATVNEVAHSSSAPAVSVSKSEFDGVPVDITAGTPLTLSSNNATAYTLVDGSAQIWGTLFGGGNGDYTYVSDYDDKTTEIAAGTAAERIVIRCDDPPTADEPSSFVDINVGNGYIDRVFGGGNNVTSGNATFRSQTQNGIVIVLMNCAGSDPTDDDNNVQVGTIFGANNKASMIRVPRILLLKGKVGNVYGGGNMGDMLGNVTIEGLPLSTYVVTPSDKVVVTKNVYGGCNVADVSNDTYVKITQGIVRGDIFGGNDLSGEVGISHVIIDGADGKDLRIRGNVYGGGNGDYPFYLQQRDANGAYYTKSDNSTVYAYDDDEAAEGAVDGVAGKYCYSHFEYFDLDGRPYVDSAAVVLNGEFTIDGNVYGGGISGDCRKTNVLVDAEEGVFNGMIFGAGRGRIDNMGLLINGTCKELYIGVAQFDTATGKTKVDVSGNIVYGEGNAMGNVLDTAWLTVRQFKSMSGGRSAMFGGGQSGNVRNTMVTYENTAVNPLEALYLGCLASDVTGTATGVIDAYEPTNKHWIIDTLYGGNDFTGRVEHTRMIVNSGIFTHLFGAGNGDYNYDQWIASRTDLDDDRTTLNGGGCADTVPYSMDVNIDINGGEFLNTVYGGGNMGLVGDRDMVHTDMVATNADRADYIGTITLNIHAGEFHRHVFTGARGKTDMEGSTFFGLKANQATYAADGQTLGKQLAYAQKILNMDGGHVAFSVYGGSEAVDDGFPYECIGAANYASNPNQNTTLRPSTIMNITGGRIEKSVYGGGYQGNIYGSVYVNIGIDAVRDCPAWGKTFGNVNIADYKPNLLDHSGYTMTNTNDPTDSTKVIKTFVPVTSSTIAGNTTLKRNVIDLEASVYNASDWGEAGTNAYFLTRGVFGGVTNILVDGKGYTTSINPINVEDPAMNINYSIIGAGTSTEGGDVNRLITLRHYGNYECPDPSKTLYSIQRADKVILDSVFIDLYGEQDAFSAYASPSYSLCRIDTIIFRVDNILMIESPGIYIGKWASLRTDEVYDIDNPNHLYDNIPVAQDVITEAVGETPAVYSTEPNDFFDNLYPQNVSGDCNTSQCNDLGPCLRLPTLRGTDKYTAARNVLMMRNGSYVRVSPFIDAHNNQTPTDETPDGLDDGNHDFGHVYGWMYLLAQDATMSYVYADTKMTGRNEIDGGFVSTCRCENLQTGFENELPYTNVVATAISNEYRSWTIGTNQGSRVRHITLVANAVPDNRLNYDLNAGSYDLFIKDNDTEEPDPVVVDAADDYAYATTVLELPPANGGNFYVINSVIIDQDNGGQLQLVDQAYENKYGIFFQTSSDPSAANGLTKIGNDPDYTFGLAFASDDNFDGANCWNKTTPPPSFNSVTAPGVQFTRNLVNSETTERYACWKHSVISGNQYITNQGGYISNAIVGGAVGAIPTMKFTLTYNKNIHTTVTRDVIFTMFEFDQAGNFVGPVEVTVTISTVIKDFADLEAPVLAMYNEGITNEYVRKITIPASFQQRDIYITGIEWMKDDIDPDATDGGQTVYQSSQKANWFHLEEYTGAVPNNNNHFSVIVKPTESASENINNTLGWYHIAHPEGVDVYKLAKDDYNETTGTTDFGTGTRDVEYRSWDYLNNGIGEGNNTDITNMGTEGKGYWLGTLDGRSTASIDVSLKFNGMWYYHKQFTPPLAWVRLKCHYYNTKSDGDGEFWIYVKIRTRFQGDTIYMAPEPTLTRTAGTGAGAQTLTMHAYGYGYDETDGKYHINGNLYDEIPEGTTPNYNLHDRAAKRELITNNPNNYLQDFKQVMEIFDEGDVIDIMETIPIWKGDEPVTVMGDDYSIIQIIRYSGSHYKFPTLDCANYDPLVEIRGNGRLTMRNIWFNGSGCTRVKGDTNVAPTATITGGTYNSVGGGSVEINGNYYYDNHRRVNALLFAQSPIIYVHQHGEAAFTKNVIFSNNFNNSYDKDLTTDVANPNFKGGGAIALVNDNVPNAQGNTGSAPTVTVGDMGHIYDNLVVDWNAANATAPAVTGGTHDWLPRNYGGGVYVDGGQFIVGGGDKGVDVQINRNFYLKNTSNNYGVQTKTAHMFSDVDSDIPISFKVYYLDTINHAQAFSLSNVYLKRTPSDCGGTPLVRLDQQNDVVYFLSEMSSTSRIGISKWFPGYIYHNTRTGGSNFLDRRGITVEELRDRPRDTISIARIARGKSSNSMVDNNYAYGVFFNDSAYYSATGGTASFVNQYPAVTYSDNREAYPGYNDKVFVYRHSSLSPYIIYFQRCASFGKGIYQLEETNACFNTEALNDRGLQFNNYIKGDSISYHWNSAATCALAMDTLKFRVGGGFFPYTYKWYNVSDTTYSTENPSEYTVDRQLMHSRITTGSNAIARFGTAGDANEQLRKQAEFDTLVFRTEVSTSDNRHNYAFEAVATDLTGNCVVRQPVKIRTVKVATDHHDDGKFMYDYANFLQHRKRGAISGTDTAAQRSQELFYRIKSPGVDSSSFHDHVGSVPDHHLAVSGEAEEGGLRRAGYTHVTATEEASDTFTGLPYAGDGTDAVGDMTPRYLRIFRSYRVKPSIYPVGARGSVAIYDANDNLLEDLNATNMSNKDYHPNFEVCPGEVLKLHPTTDETRTWEYVGWDFDPSSPANANFVVGNDVASNRPVVYYVPGDYWWQVVNKFENHTGAPTGTDDTYKADNIATLDDYELDYYGNVTIHTEKGLAWLISTVNGYNGQNAQTFHFNTITLANTDALDMSAHKWTPLGNENNPFEGVFDGNGKHITNIIVNENTIVPVGIFGYTKGATIRNFIVDSIMTRSNSYVSAIVAEATDGTVLDNITIQRGAIFGEYIIGGFIAHMVNSSIFDCKLNRVDVEVEENSKTIGAYGNAIYAGGFLGHLEGVNTGRNLSHTYGYIDVSKLSALYVGAIYGKNDGNPNPIGKSGERTSINNCYARLLTSNSSQRVGGLAGYANDIEMNNCYVYGVADYNKQSGFNAGLVGYINENVSISNCYYVDGMSDNMVGINMGAMPQKSTTFKGKGNQVMLTTPVDGYNNLTRALNAWVRDHGDTIYSTWRSDLDGVNNGYPIFGEPDLIPVNDTLVTSSCETFEFDGLTFDQSGAYVFHIIDSSDFVDSTLTLMLTINYGDTTEVSDTVDFGNGYVGNGFNLTPEDLRAAMSHGRTNEVMALQFIDSLQNANGCDSLVVLTLYVTGVTSTPEVQKLVDVKVYPNPTRSIVNVEGSDLKKVEVYDNVSRRILTQSVDGDRTTFDLSNQASGSYYVRISTAHGTVVKKVIKK